MATATSTEVRKGALIHAQLPGRKQPRLYKVMDVAKGSVTLRLAWAEKGKEFPVLGIEKEFKVSELKGVRPFGETKGDEKAEAEA